MACYGLWLIDESTDTTTFRLSLIGRLTPRVDAAHAAHAGLSLMTMYRKRLSAPGIEEKAHYETSRHKPAAQAVSHDWIQRRSYGITDRVTHGQAFIWRCSLGAEIPLSLDGAKTGHLPGGAS